jgi:hypothetical protein
MNLSDKPARIVACEFKNKRNRNISSVLVNHIHSHIWVAVIEIIKTHSEVAMLGWLYVTTLI